MKNNKIRFWCYTVEPPNIQRKKVFGIIKYYSKSRNKYVVEWDKDTPLKWVEWCNGKMSPQNISIL